MNQHHYFAIKSEEEDDSFSQDDTVVSTKWSCMTGRIAQSYILTFIKFMASSFFVP